MGRLSINWSFLNFIFNRIHGISFFQEFGLMQTQVCACEPSSLLVLATGLAQSHTTVSLVNGASDCAASKHVRPVSREIDTNLQAARLRSSISRGIATGWGKRRGHFLFWHSQRFQSKLYDHSWLLGNKLNYRQNFEFRCRFRRAATNVFVCTFERQFLETALLRSWFPYFLLFAHKSDHHSSIHEEKNATCFCDVFDWHWAAVQYGVNFRHSLHMTHK